MIEEFILFAVLGVFSGLIAGMFGVGGGVIIVPVLVASFMGYGFDESIIIHLAIGTSLACIFFTGLSSANAHRKKHAIDFTLFKQVALGITLGALLGAMFAVQLDGNLLKIIIGVFALIMAVQIGFNFTLSLKNNLSSILTSAVLPGTVQLTPSGKCIILMQDCQVTGGYPRILQLSEIAIARVSQKISGDKIQFILEEYS